MPAAVLLRRLAFVALAGAVLGGCASRPVNAPLVEADRRAGYRYETRTERSDNDPSTVVVLAFSGGGMRAAAFSYGVLEELRRTEVTLEGRRTRLLDQVDLITGVSGGSFTALAYGLHGEKLFDDYERRFLKHDVQADLVEFDLICSDLATVPLARAAAASSAVPLVMSPVTIVARWNTIRGLRESGVLDGAPDTSLVRAVDVPNIELYAIDVSIEAHPDAAERAFLNEAPTSWALSDEQVDRLRAAPATILRSSAEYARLLRDLAPRDGASPAAPR